MARETFRFTTPPFPILAQYLAEDKDFLADAKAILSVDDALYSELADALVDEKSFLNRESLKGVVQRVLGPNGPAAQKISAFIWRLHRILRHDSSEPLDRSITLLRDAITKHSKKLTDEDKSRLAERIQKLVVAPAGLARQYKAEQLAEATGTELQELQVICDIRPVFNEARTEIEGAIPISILKLDFAAPDGTSSRIEVRLNESEVADLCEKAQCAKSKLRTCFEIA